LYFIMKQFLITYGLCAWHGNHKRTLLFNETTGGSRVIGRPLAETKGIITRTN
jgi:hypothetical protein